MKKVVLILVIALLIGCTDTAAKLPENYPDDIFPMIEGATLKESEVSGDVVTLTFISKMSINEVKELYKEAFEKSNVLSINESKEIYVEIGTIEGYNYTLEIKPLNNSQSNIFLQTAPLLEGRPDE